jgi:hypothetical protein
MVYWASPDSRQHLWSCPVRRSTVPPDRVPGFHQCDPRRISVAGAALRGRVSSPYGGVALRWEAPDRPSFQRVPDLSLTDLGGSVAVSSRICEDVLPAGSPGAPLWHGPEQSPSEDPRALAHTASGPADPRRGPGPFPDSARPAPRGRGGRHGCRRGCARGGISARRHARGPPFAQP